MENTGVIMVSTRRFSFFSFFALVVKIASRFVMSIWSTNRTRTSARGIRYGMHVWERDVEPFQVIHLKTANSEYFRHELILT